MGWLAAGPQPAEDRVAMNVIAAVRGVSEYQLFVDAHREWHGRAPEKHILEADFGRYLRSGQVPEFVRHYLRNYESRHPQEMAAYRCTLRKENRIRRLAFWSIVLMVIVALSL